jgi:hypothetical protein
MVFSVGVSRVGGDFVRLHFPCTYDVLRLVEHHERLSIHQEFLGGLESQALSWILYYILREKRSVFLDRNSYIFLRLSQSQSQSQLRPVKLFHQNISI